MKKFYILKNAPTLKHEKILYFKKCPKKYVNDHWIISIITLKNGNIQYFEKSPKKYVYVHFINFKMQRVGAALYYFIKNIYSTSPVGASPRNFF